MTTFIVALWLLAVPSDYSAYTFLDKGQIPPLPAPNNEDESLISDNLQVIAHLCNKSPEAGS